MKKPQEGTRRQVRTHLLLPEACTHANPLAEVGLQCDAALKRGQRFGAPPLLLPHSHEEAGP